MICAVLAFAAGGTMLHAQDAVDRKVDGMVDRARQSYGPAAPAKPCTQQNPDGEIVVCAPDDGKQWRIAPSSTTDPTSRAATRTGVPRAPQLDRGSCRGKVGCLTGGWAPGAALIIDLSKIPETPADSDAEKVAKGEMSDR